jgi:hypothetical protein
VSARLGVSPRPEALEVGSGSTRCSRILETADRLQRTIDQSTRHLGGRSLFKEFTPLQSSQSV